MSLSIREPRTRVSISVRIKGCPSCDSNSNNCSGAKGGRGLNTEDTEEHRREQIKIPPLAKCARGVGHAGFLEQRGGAALPGFAFFCGDLFHVTDVGSGLGQYMVQVVADADER